MAVRKHEVLGFYLHSQHSRIMIHPFDVQERSTFGLCRVDNRCTMLAIGHDQSTLPQRRPPKYMTSACGWASRLAMTKNSVTVRQRQTRRRPMTRIVGSAVTVGIRSLNVLNVVTFELSSRKIDLNKKYHEQPKKSQTPSKSSDQTTTWPEIHDGLGLVQCYLKIKVRIQGVVRPRR